MNKDLYNVTVERHDDLRDQVVDITSRVGINRDKYGNKFSQLIHTDDLIPFPLSEGMVPAESIPYYQLGVEWGKLSKAVRRQEVSKVEEWGPYKISYVTFWYITYEISVPVDIIGG